MGNSLLPALRKCRLFINLEFRGCASFVDGEITDLMGLISAGPNAKRDAMKTNAGIWTGCSVVRVYEVEILDGRGSRHVSGPSLLILVPEFLGYSGVGAI